MRKSDLLIIAEAPPTGTEGAPPVTGCQRIQTDQQGLPWPDIPQPWPVSIGGAAPFLYVRGETSLAIGRFEGYFYIPVSGGFDQYLIMSSISGTWVSDEDLRKSISATGPWLITTIKTATPPGQVDVDCDIGCVGAECDPGNDNFLVQLEDPFDIIVCPSTAPPEIVPPGTNPFDPWIGQWSYLTTIPGGDAPPFTSGTVRGVSTDALAEIRRFIDPGVGMGTLTLTVEGITVGHSATRFFHGETLDHGASTGLIILANPHKEVNLSPEA